AGSAAAQEGAGGACAAGARPGATGGTGAGRLRCGGGHGGGGARAEAAAIRGARECGAAALAARARHASGGARCATGNPPRPSALAGRGDRARLADAGRGGAGGGQPRTAADVARESPPRHARGTGRTPAPGRPDGRTACLARRRHHAAAQHRRDPPARLRRRRLRGAGRRRADRRRPRRPARRPARARRLRRAGRQGLPPAGTRGDRPHRAGLRAAARGPHPPEPAAAAPGRAPADRRRGRTESLVEPPAVRPHPDRRAVLGHRRAAPTARRAPAPPCQRHRRAAGAAAAHPGRAVAASGARRAAAVHHLLAAARGKRGDRGRAAGGATGRTHRRVRPAGGAGRCRRLADPARRWRPRRHVLCGARKALTVSLFRWRERVPKAGEGRGAAARPDRVAPSPALPGSLSRQWERRKQEAHPLSELPMFALSKATPQERRQFWLFLLIALVILGAGIGLRDPWPSDEPRFTLAAKQMVESGDWMFPHRGSELYADKPPMLMWAEAASFELVRWWRLAFMLPSLLAGLGTLLLVYDLGRRLWNRRTGLYAAGGLLLAFQFVYQSQRAQIDPLVMFFITAANWGLLRHLLAPPDDGAPRATHWPLYWLGCFCAGLGVITKGVGFLALLMLAPYAWAAWRGWDGVARPGRGAWWRWLLGLVAVLAAIALWLVPMLLTAHARDGNPAYAAYVHDILFKQTAKRYAN